MWGSHGEAICSPCSQVGTQSHRQLIPFCYNFCSLPEFRPVHVGVSSGTPVHKTKHVMLRGCINFLVLSASSKEMSLLTPSLKEKVQCWWCLSFSPCSAEAAGCSSRTLNLCALSKQGRWSSHISRHSCSTGKAMPGNGHF